jgi:hypothetical protein
MVTEIPLPSSISRSCGSPKPSPGRGVTTIDRSVYPDGIKTSGQHPPIYDLVRAFEEFPVSIEGPTVWKPEDYTNHREKWVHPFSPEELLELSTAADAFIASGERLVGISKVISSFVNLRTTSNHNCADQFQATASVRISSGTLRRHTQWQRLCPFSGFANRDLGPLQGWRSIYGSFSLSRAPNQSKCRRIDSWSCRRPGPQSSTARKSEDLEDKCPVRHIIQVLEISSNMG